MTAASSTKSFSQVRLTLVIVCRLHMYIHFKLIIAAPSLVRYQLLFAFLFGIQPDKSLSMCGHKSFCVAQLARVLIFRKSLIPIQSANQVVLKFSYLSKPINCKTVNFSAGDTIIICLEQD